MRSGATPCAAGSRADDGALAARHDRHALRHGEDPARRAELAGLLQRLLLGSVRPGDDALGPRVDDVVGLRRVASRLRLNLGEQRVERGALDRLAANRDRGPGQGLLEVEELELRGRSDDLGRRLRILHAGQLDHDLVVALRADLGLGDAELVDAAPHDLDRTFEVFLGELAVRRRHGLERHLEATLEVETERRRLVEGRGRDREQRHADERRGEQPENQE